MWKLADADTDLYLFGTIHLLPEGQGWRTPALDCGAGRLGRAGARGRRCRRHDGERPGDGRSSACAPGLPPIAERVPEGKRAALRSMIAESGYPEAVFDRLETWAAALPLLGVTFKRLGLDPSLGVERQIGAPFRAAGKTVTGLETVEQQFGFFDTLSEDGAAGPAALGGRGQRRDPGPVPGDARRLGERRPRRASPAPSTTRPRCRPN